MKGNDSLRRSKILRDERTVLNIDSYDRRRFQEIFKLSNELQRVRDESQIPTIDSLLRDIWAAFFKMKPSVLHGKVHPSLLFNRILLIKWIGSTEFKAIQSYTKLDDFSSAICTLKVGEKINEWFNEIASKNLSDAVLIQALQEYPNEHTQALSNEPSENEQNRLAEPLENNIEEMFDFILSEDEELTAKFAKDVLEENIYIENKLGVLIGGIKAGNSRSELKLLPLREKLFLAEQLAISPELCRIMEWAGHMEEIIQQKNKTEKANRWNRNGIVFGNELERALPVELALYQHPITKTDFLRRFSEKNMMQFDINKRSNLGKGPIIICVDQSDSMNVVEMQSKGFVLAILSIAQKQRRDVSVIFFSKEFLTFEFKKGKIKTTELLRLAKVYLRGGTDFSVALTEALKIIDTTTFTKADILFISDGEGEVCENFLSEFHQRQKEKKFQVQSILIGSQSERLLKFSDKVSCLEDFDEHAIISSFDI